MSLSTSVEVAAQPTVEKSGLRRPLPLILRRWLREPLLHFLLLGVVLFGVYGYTHRGRSGVEPSHQIPITLEDLRSMDLYFESQWHRQPTPEEFQAMVQDKVREEVLYREGIAMGLDKNDEIVKRRMAQKMQFLAEDVAAAHDPTTDELKSWFEKNSANFAQPPWCPCARGCCECARATDRPARRCESTRVVGRPVHVSGLLPGPCAGLSRQ